MIQPRTQPSIPVRRPPLRPMRQDVQAGSLPVNRGQCPNAPGKGSFRGLPTASGTSVTTPTSWPLTPGSLDRSSFGRGRPVPFL